MVPECVYDQRRKRDFRNQILTQKLNYIDGSIVRGADLNRYTFSMLNIEEKIYLFKLAHFIIAGRGENIPTSYNKFYFCS